MGEANCTASPAHVLEETEGRGSSNGNVIGVGLCNQEMKSMLHAMRGVCVVHSPSSYSLEGPRARRKPDFCS